MCYMDYMDFHANDNSYRWMIIPMITYIFSVRSSQWYNLYRCGNSMVDYTGPRSKYQLVIVSKHTGVSYKSILTKTVQTVNQSFIVSNILMFLIKSIPTKTLHAVNVSQLSFINPLWTMVPPHSLSCVSIRDSPRRVKILVFLIKAL